MRIGPLPKRWLIHSIEYYEYLGEDDWSNPIYGEPIIIKNVRFDDSTVFSRDTTQTKILADAVIFVDVTHSDPVPDFKERSRIQFGDREMILQKVIPCFYPHKNEVRHYELEVI